MRRLVLIIVLTLCLSLPLVMSIIVFYSVPVSAAKNMVDSIPSLVVLDVRFLNEYNSGHIRNAKHIPVGELVGRLDELETTDLILVYCQSGGRSETASQILAENGFGNIVNMLGGITAWINAGYPVYIKYSSIQNAINTANEGDTIYVSVGTYNENVVLNKRLQLIGEGSEGSKLIAADSTQHAMRVVSNDVMISGFQISGATSSEYPLWASGIYLDGVNSTQLVGNSVVNNHFGIWLEYSNNNSIIDNTVCFNYMGIRIDYDCCSNTVQGNNASFNDWDGILINRYSNHTTVSDNTASSNKRGISIGYSDYGTFAKNQIYNNSWYGIQILYPSHHNRFFGNNIRLNTEGINFNAVGLSYNNTFFHNNFIDNHFGNNVYGMSDWDFYYEGNYWSDYEERYLNATYDRYGIWNTPYLIDESNQDNYPLINPYWDSGDIDHDLDVDLFDVVLAASIYGSISLDPEWNPHCDIAEPFGIIDIFDLVMIVSQYGEEYTP